MPEIHLPQLQPNATYQVQLRSTGRGTLSEWSPVFTFTTGGDDVAPKAPENVVVDASGAAFLLTWDKVTENEDGTPTEDLFNYEIVMRSVSTGQEYTFPSFVERFEIDYWMNRNAFGGVYQGSVEFDLYSVDKSGNRSTVPTTVSAEKLPTPSPTDLTVSNEGSDFIFTWTEPVGDVKDYRINIFADGRTKHYWVTGNTWTLTRAQNMSAFGGFEPSIDFEIRTRNSVEMISEPPATITASDPLPNPPTNFVAVVGVDSFDFSWTAPTQNTDASPLTDLDGYNVTIITTAGNRTYYAPDPNFSFTYAMNAAAFLTPQGSMTVEVRAREVSGRQGEPLISGTIQNDPPPAPTNLAGTPDGDRFVLTWTPPVNTPDLSHYELWYADTATDAGQLHTTLPKQLSAYTFESFDYDVTKYVWLKSVDNFGLASDPTARVSFTPESPFAVDATPPAGTTLTATTATRPASEPSAVDLAWTASPDPDGDLAGYHIRYSSEGINGPWQYYNILDEDAAPTVTIEGLVSETLYTFQIRSYDTMINTSGWSTAVTATSSVSEVPPMTEVTGDILVRTGGSIQSEDYDDVANTGWWLGPTGLEIEQGRINARVVSAGELRSNQNVTTDGTTQPKWSLNLDGNMSINDAQVRGKIVVGSAAAPSSNVSIASYNYAGTGAQWALKGDGTFDIKSGTGARVQLSSTGLTGHNGSIETFSLSSAGSLMVDGQIRAGSGDFYGNVNVTGRLEVYGGDSYIIARKSGPSGGNWVMLDGRTSTNYAINSSTGRFTVDYDGNMRATNAYLSGEISAQTGYIGGWTINSTSLTSASGGVTLSNNGNINGADISGGTVRGSTVRSSNTPGNSYSWSIDSSSGYRVWNSGGQQTVTIDINGNTTINNLTAYGGSFTGAVTANSGSFTGTVYASGGSFTGTVYAATFFSDKARWGGTKNWIEIGSSGSGDYVDEARFYNGGTVSSIRNPSNAPGGMVISTQSHGLRVIGNINSTGSAIYTEGGWLHLGGGTVSTTGNIVGGEGKFQNGTYSGNYWNNAGSIYFRPTASNRIESGNSANAYVYYPGKTFVIPHPTPEKKDTHYLVHAAAEGPTADVFYRGTAHLAPERSTFTEQRVARTVVTLPDYFEDLVAEEGRTVSITPVVGFCETEGCNQYLPCNVGASEVKDGQFTAYNIGGYLHECTKFYWEVKGTRKDITPVDVEPSTSDYEIAGDGPYTYLTKKLV